MWDPSRWMSPADRKEVVSVALAAWSRGDWDAALELLAPEVELDNSRVQGEWRGVHRGREGVLAMWRRFVEPWESVEVEIGEFHDAGDDVITLMRGRVSGRDGIELPVTTWCRWTVRDGKLTRIFISNERADVFDAVG